MSLYTLSRLGTFLDGVCKGLMKMNLIFVQPVISCLGVCIRTHFTYASMGTDSSAGCSEIS